MERQESYATISDIISVSEASTYDKTPKKTKTENKDADLQMSKKKLKVLKDALRQEKEVRLNTETQLL